MRKLKLILTKLTRGEKWIEEYVTKLQSVKIYFSLCVFSIYWEKAHIETYFSIAYRTL